MQELEKMLLNRAKELLSNKTVDRVLGWKKDEFSHDVSPAVFYNEQQLEDFVYNCFCGANLSKYLVNECKKGGKILVFLKPCDTYSFNQLVKEHRISKDSVYTIGVECQGKLKFDKVCKNGFEYYDSVTETVDKVTFTYGETTKTFDKDELKLSKCLVCEKKLVAGDEKIVLHEKVQPKQDRFETVKKLESMTADERFAFWKEQLSKCIRCNACRNVCPCCTCVKCVFDNDDSTISSKANSDSFEEKLFHIIRSFHVAGRCTDCGECSRVCPQDIPLHLINRKYISDINRLYGDYQAGEDDVSVGPLTRYDKEDVDPNDAVGGKK